VVWTDGNAVRTADFHYELPPELIAQTPAAQRDQSRLLVLRRPEGQLEHRCFSDLLEYLRPGDVLVLNDSRVIPARLRARKGATGGQVEVLLVEANACNDWWVMLRPGKRVRPGTELHFQTPVGASSSVTATVLAKNLEGLCRLRFAGVEDIRKALAWLGEAPLPPYIERVGGARPEDNERYQTVYAGPPGSVAAPTAGLHFTEALLERVRHQGVGVCFVTLHVGLGTFAPVKARLVEQHQLHAEAYEISPATAAAVNEARKEGRRVIAVGTTTVRVLETVARQNDGAVAAGAGRTRLFIYPPSEFKVADAMLTNFHLPESTLLMLVSAFAAPGQTRGRDLILAAYAEAVRQRYRFYSYGDAMLIL
jgi:S-adenosylmethionine:tRNA ribosyltransferase-isomerase